MSSSATTTSSSSTGGAGTGGTASTGGAGGAISTGGTGVGGVGGGIGGAGGKLPTCKHCADAIGPQGTSMGLCTDSTVLYEALSTCLCLPTNCGMSCQKSCTGAGMNSGCAQCEQTADTGACKTQYDACAADTP